MAFSDAEGKNGHKGVYARYNNAFLHGIYDHYNWETHLDMFKQAKAALWRALNAFRNDECDPPTGSAGERFDYAESLLGLEFPTQEEVAKWWGTQIPRWALEDQCTAACTLRRSAAVLGVAGLVVVVVITLPGWATVAVGGAAVTIAING